MFKSKRNVLETLEKIGFDNPFRVTFLKKDESWRSMNAVMHRPEKPKFGEPSVIVVHDLDEDQWRSFDPSRVVGITGA
jgi:hypothetical protein